MTKQKGGKYSLVSDFSTLFKDSPENTSESIFELQISESNKFTDGKKFFTLEMEKRLSLWMAKSQRIFTDYHAKTYGVADKRYDATYLSNYFRADKWETSKSLSANPEEVGLVLYIHIFSNLPKKTQIMRLSSTVKTLLYIDMLNCY